MSENARQRAAMRRNYRRDKPARRKPEDVTRDAGLEAEIAEEEGAPVNDSADDTDVDTDVSAEPAEPTVSGNREELVITLRRRDRRFLEALAVHWDCTPEQCADRLIRQAHVKMRASSGDTMRYEEFSTGAREPDPHS